MSWSRNKSHGIYKVAPPARMHKIFTQVTLRTLTRVLLHRFIRRVSQIGEDVAALCYQRVSPRLSTRRNFFPTRNLPTAMCLATELACRASRLVCLFSLIILSFLTLNSRLPHYPALLSPPCSLRSQLPSFISSVALAYFLCSFLSCNNHIPGEYRAPSFRTAFVAREKYNIWEEKVSKKLM